jgi:hypothetical protein
VQDHATNQLHVKGTQTQHAPGALTNNLRAGGGGEGPEAGLGWERALRHAQMGNGDESRMRRKLQDWREREGGGG